MMSTTHAMFAKELREHIYLMYGVKLKKTSLVYGSIKPDASTIFAKYPHYINKSLDMLCERISILEEIASSIENIETRAFSRELGVVSHYLADYFCRVHNDINGIKHNENFGHILYEQKLARKTKQQELNAIREEILNRIDRELINIEKTSIKSYIVTKHRKYMCEAGKLFLYNNTRKRYMLDIRYAMEMIIVIGTYIFQNIQY